MLSLQPVMWAHLLDLFPGGEQSSHYGHAPCCVRSQFLPGQHLIGLSWQSCRVYLTPSVCIHSSSKMLPRCDSLRDACISHSTQCPAHDIAAQSQDWYQW